MANQRTYIPPHRRTTSIPLSIPSSNIGQVGQTPRESLFEGTILGLRHLRLQPPSEASTSVLVESQSVRRGHGTFSAPSQTEMDVRSVEALVSETEHDDDLLEGEVQKEEENDEDEEAGEDDLNTASAVYSSSTNFARTSTISTTPSIFGTDISVRAHTPLPTREWDSAELSIAPLPPKPPITSPTEPVSKPLIERITPVYLRPLAERIGGLYIPPGARLSDPSPRDDSGFWQSQNTRRPPLRSRIDGSPRTRDDLGFWQYSNSRSSRMEPPRSQANIIRRQRDNIRLQKFSNDPGPSRKCTLLPSFAQIAVLFHTLGEKVTEFKIDDIAIKEGEGISDVRYAGSYKWIQGDEGVPTLAVPAVPDIWDPPAVVGKLTLDKDIKDYEEFPDYASALLPASLSTLEPLFLSLTSPDVLHDIDVVTGRNNLRKLWSALRASDNHHTSPWRIDVEYVNCGDTPGLVILERFEPPQGKYRHSPNGYRQSYQEATTRRVLDGSDRTPGCNRIISYTYGGLRMLVGFDTPAFRPGKSNWTAYESGVTNLFEEDKTTDGISTMDGLDFDDPVYNGQSIRIRHTTLKPPSQGECLSIKTKQQNDIFDAEYHFPQIYFSQTPHVIYARHSYGDFKFPIQEYDLFNDPVPKHIQVERQETINKVAAVLRWVVSLTREYKRGLGLIWDGKSFSVCEREKGPELSAPVKEMIMDVRGRDQSVLGDGSVLGA